MALERSHALVSANSQFRWGRVALALACCFNAASASSCVEDGYEMSACAAISSIRHHFVELFDVVGALVAANCCPFTRLILLARVGKMIFGRFWTLFRSCLFTEFEGYHICSGPPGGCMPYSPMFHLRVVRGSHWSVILGRFFVAGARTHHTNITVLACRG